MNPHVYLHETIDIVGQGRAAYNHHMTANFGREAREGRGLHCVGVFSTVGSTEAWPQSTNLWEYANGWPGVAAHFRTEFSNPRHQDDVLVEWWAAAAALRRGGYDRLLVPAGYSPSLAQLLADGVRGECYYHELVACVPGRARDYLELVERYRLALAEHFGWRLVGAYRTAMVNDSEALVVWAVPTWDAWAHWEAAQEADPSVALWRGHVRAFARDWRNKLLVASELSPIQTGREL